MAGGTRVRQGRRWVRGRGLAPEPDSIGRDSQLHSTRRASRLLPSVGPIGGFATRRDAIFRRLLILADLVAVGVGLAIVSASTRRGLPIISLALLPLTVLFVKLAGRYDHDEVVIRKSTLDELPSLVAVAAVCAVAWALITEASGMSTNHVGVGVLWVSASISLVVARSIARAVARHSAPTERVLIAGSERSHAQLAHRLESDPTARSEVVGCLSLEPERIDVGDRAVRPSQTAFTRGDLETAVRELRVDRVLVVSSGSDSETTFEALTRANAAGVKVSILPGLLEVVGSAVEFDEVGGLMVLSVRRSGLGRSSLILKRAMDVAGATIGLIVLVPLWLVAAVAIKLDLPGPVYFRQRRVGRDGEVFELIKFRSMVVGADAERAALAPLNESAGVFKLARDPRVTRVGRVLRRTSFDETPQLINVLRGEMSLVGPRPLVLDEDRLVEGRHRNRLQLAPGMTGPWQVLGPKRPPLGEMVKIDFLYAANWSLWNDIKLLVRTMSHVVGLRGL